MQFRPAARCVSLIASGSADKAIQLWDAASRQQTGEPSLRVCIRRSGKCCGGHAPPTRQRYHRLWALVTEAITRCDQATVYDNSGIKGPRIVVQMSEGSSSASPPGRPGHRLRCNTLVRLNWRRRRRRGLNAGYALSAAAAERIRPTVLWCTRWWRPMVLGGTPASRCARIVATSRESFDVTPSRTMDSATPSQRSTSEVATALNTAAGAGMSAAWSKSGELPP